ncbi:MAG: fatty acid desaturase [Bacteroidetes bacterium]|nr:fatty acid desaturase [Bacteroidota bacterium]
MLQGKQLILATKPFAKEIRSLSWFHTLSTFFLLVLSFVAVLIFKPLILKLIFSILTGLIIVRMFVIVHDYFHKTILKGSLLAEVIFTFWGLYILVPKSIWSRSHDYHHVNNSKLYTSSIGSFPIVTKEKFLKSSKTERLYYLFIRHPLTIALGYFSAFMYGMCIQSLLTSPKKHWDSAVSLMLHFGIGFLIYYNFGWINFMFAFLLPALISSALGAYLFYAQHNFPDATFKEKEGWTYVSAALNSSSYMKMNPIMHWFTANIGYHHIHHLNHNIPFYRLPEVFENFPELQNPGVTSLSIKDIIACLKLKVWDSEKQKMVGLK